jgi:hypothetical protein
MAACDTSKFVFNYASKIPAGLPRKRDAFGCGEDQTFRSGLIIVVEEVELRIRKWCGQNSHEGGFLCSVSQSRYGKCLKGRASRRKNLSGAATSGHGAQRSKTRLLASLSSGLDIAPELLPSAAVGRGSKAAQVRGRHV